MSRTSIGRRPCLACGSPTAGTRCPTCTRDKGYDTTYWYALRRDVLTRDNYRCRLQHDGCTIVATSVHLDPNLKGLHTVAYATDCLAACLHCHGIEDGARASYNLQDV